MPFQQHGSCTPVIWSRAARRRRSGWHSASRIMSKLLLDALLASDERQAHRQHNEGERGQQEHDPQDVGGGLPGIAPVAVLIQYG